jgi:hypothetical protein
MKTAGQFFANDAKFFLQLQQIKIAVTKELRADQIPALLVTIQFPPCVFPYAS